jgi:hypothetical protein
MNKEELTAKAEALGIEVDPEWTKAQIQGAMDSMPPIKVAKPAPAPAAPTHTRGDGSDAGKPIALAGHQGMNPGRHADQYPG